MHVTVHVTGRWSPISFCFFDVVSVSGIKKNWRTLSQKGIKIGVRLTIQDQLTLGVGHHMFSCLVTVSSSGAIEPILSTFTNLLMFRSPSN